MANERRNLYRLLFVQPEAPPEVIKAAYRALMTTLRMHPDLGGNTDTAAQLNAAYAVLSDPQLRAQYDQRLRRPPRTSAPGAAGAATETVAPRDPSAWQLEQRCPLCGAPFGARPPTGHRCARCDSPLTPAPTRDTGNGAEILGRRGSTRVVRDLPARVRLAAGAAERPARVRDLSVTGLALALDTSPPKGSALRVVTGLFDAVAQVVATRRTVAGATVHARLLTLQVMQLPHGVVVDFRA